MSNRLHHQLNATSTGTDCTHFSAMRKGFVKKVCNGGTAVPAEAMRTHEKTMRMHCERIARGGGVAVLALNAFRKFAQCKARFCYRALDALLALLSWPCCGRIMVLG